MKNSQNKFVRFILTIIEKFNEARISDKSAIMTYFILLSIGPFLMSLITLITYLLQSRSGLLIQALKGSFADSEDLIQTVLNYLAQATSPGIAIFGTLVALYTVSKAIRTLAKSINEIFQIETKRGFANLLKETMFSYIFTVALVFSMIFFLVLVVYENPILWAFEYISGLRLEDFLNFSLISKLAPYLYLFLLMTLSYRFIANFNINDRLPWRLAALGGGFVSLGWFFTSSAFSFYVNNFNKRNIMYGTIGSIMVLILWIYLLMSVLLMGAVVISAYSQVYLDRVPGQVLSDGNGSKGRKDDR